MGLGPPAFSDSAAPYQQKGEEAALDWCAWASAGLRHFHCCSDCWQIGPKGIKIVENIPKVRLLSHQGCCGPPATLDQHNV